MDSDALDELIKKLDELGRNSENRKTVNDADLELDARCSITALLLLRRQKVEVILGSLWDELKQQI